MLLAGRRYVATSSFSFLLLRLSSPSLSSCVCPSKLLFSFSHDSRHWHGSAKGFDWLIRLHALFYSTGDASLAHSQNIRTQLTGNISVATSP
ncbi:hypothetical protein DFP72DRAFT_875632 [Ephemerocybe angulata]|uniref:Secreted protein n=1 Tax=Ephemerocybe angulata TaxID=980116 RepID=A0A8H6ID90_9AGAR|nr:hypothetical protein DFP72DRAFT_875594 [Tulosesus angulatus]KAF6763440.1 hypothetical protein DFP72DRAFT_875632 [Tulosesus angulatus]